jgi:hypothetical protein
MTDQDGLTPMAREFADVIGVEATLLLCEHYGGISMRCPSSKGELGNNWARLIGVDACNKFIRAYRGECISIPKLKARELKMRDEQIRKERSGGMSLINLARLHGLTTRQIINITQRGQP